MSFSLSFPSYELKIGGVVFSLPRKLNTIVGRIALPLGVLREVESE